MDATRDFFNSLNRRGPEPLLRKASGSVRFDLADGDSVESWYLAVKDGSIAVSHRKAEADAVVSCDKALFDRMIRGEVNAMAAALRGLIVPQGDLGLVLSVARLFRGATDARPAVPAAGYAKGKS
jgi:putative sterol carrier protein